MDSVSVKTTFKQTLAEKGIIFCSMGEAVKNHPDLIKQYLGSVVATTSVRSRSSDILSTTLSPTSTPSPRKARRNSFTRHRGLKTVR